MSLVLCCWKFLCCMLLVRSEEHTSELQSRLHLVCRLLLEKKKKIDFKNDTITSVVLYQKSNLSHSQFFDFFKYMRLRHQARYTSVSSSILILPFKISHTLH